MEGTDDGCWGSDVGVPEGLADGFSDNSGGRDFVAEGLDDTSCFGIVVGAWDGSAEGLPEKASEQ